MNIGIVGSRDYYDYSFFSTKVDELLKSFNEIAHSKFLIISGGARGVDSMAERYAEERHIPIKIHEAKWDEFGKSAGYKRNELIVEDSDIIIAFSHNNSKGTNHTITIAANKGIRTLIFNV